LLFRGEQAGDITYANARDAVYLQRCCVRYNQATAYGIPGVSTAKSGEVNKPQSSHGRML